MGGAADDGEVAGFRVRGRVQGVGFRWWTRTEAERLGLAGTVRNAADGSVEVRLRGDAASVAEMRALLDRGPPAARVEEVETFDGGAVPPDGFRIVP